MVVLTTFGGFQIRAGENAAKLSSRKAQALLSYLAANSDQPHERAVLAELFWPELPEAAALNNLSKALGQIRKIFEQADTGRDANRGDPAHSAHGHVIFLAA